MKKPFYKFPIYWAKRNKYSLFKFIFGKYYLTNDVNKWCAKKIKSDTTGIMFIKK